jgi:hypothetical protein
MSTQQTDLLKTGLALSRVLNKQKMASWSRIQERRRLTSGPVNQLITRRKAKSMKISARKNRQERSQSMLDMPVPKDHQLVPYLTDERAKTLFRAHHKRQEIRAWNRHDGR